MERELSHVKTLPESGSLYLINLYNHNPGWCCGEDCEPDEQVVRMTSRGAADFLMEAARSFDPDVISPDVTDAEREALIVEDKESVIEAFRSELGRWLESGATDDLVIDSLGPSADVRVLAYEP